PASSVYSCHSRADARLKRYVDISANGGSDRAVRGSGPRRTSISAAVTIQRYEIANREMYVSPQTDVSHRLTQIFTDDVVAAVYDRRIILYGTLVASRGKQTASPTVFATA